MFEIKPPAGTYSGRADILRKSGPSDSPLAAQWKYTIFKSPKHRGVNSKESANKESSDLEKDPFEVAINSKNYSESPEKVSYQSPYPKEESLNTNLKYDEEVISKSSENKIVTSKSNDYFEQIAEHRTYEGYI